MAFAPPRRITTRPPNHRKRVEADTVPDQNQVLNVIAARHREWLTDKQPTKNISPSEVDSTNASKSDQINEVQNAKLFQPSGRPAVHANPPLEELHVLDVNGSNVEVENDNDATATVASVLKNRHNGDNINVTALDANSSNLDNSVGALTSVNRSRIATSADMMITSATANYDSLYSRHPTIGASKNTSNNYSTNTSNRASSSFVYGISASNNASVSAPSIYKSNQKNSGDRPKLQNSHNVNSSVPLQSNGKYSVIKNEDREPMSSKQLRKRADELLNKSKHDVHRYGRSNRPENHFCPICKRLMALEGHNPVCIIPCGHSVCEPCSKSLKRTCTICNHDIQTTTSNIVLKKIIEQFEEENGTIPAQAPLPQDLPSVGRSSHSAKPAKSLSKRTEDIQEEIKALFPDRKQDGSNHLPSPPIRKRDYSSSGYLATSVGAANQSADDHSVHDRHVGETTRAAAPSYTLPGDSSFVRGKSDNAAGNDDPTIIPQIANINQQLSTLIKNFSGKDEKPKSKGNRKGNEAKPMFDDFPDYKPSEADLKKWTGELAAVEMRLSVMDLQARQTSSSIKDAKLRIASGEESLHTLERREQQLLENLKFTQMQLKEVEMERQNITQQMNNDQAESERCIEQLNLINYTKAGLDAEFEKLSMLCNRTV